MPNIRVAFVDDHPTLLAGLASLFCREQRFEVVGTGDSAESAKALVARSRPDVLIVDLSMPGDVFAAVAAMAALGTKVVVFTAYADTELALRAFDAGAHAFVLKGQPSGELFAAVDAVIAGRTFVSSDFSAPLISAVRNRSRRTHELAAAKLSGRETQIVDYLLQAKTNKEIARAMQLSEKTVKHYMTNLMVKLRAKNRVDVVLAVQALAKGKNTGGVPSEPRPAVAVQTPPLSWNGQGNATR